MQKCLGLTWVLVMLLSACSGVNGGGVSLGVGLGGGIGHHVGVGTSINIPIGRTTPTTNIPDNGGINVIENQIITYFDTQGQTSHAAVKGGYERRLLAKVSQNEWLVQDFYSTGEKRTDPMTLSREQVFTFRAHPNDGSYTVYAINGNMMLQQNFRQGKAIK